MGYGKFYNVHFTVDSKDLGYQSYEMPKTHDRLRINLQ